MVAVAVLVSGCEICRNAIANAYGMLRLLRSWKYKDCHCSAGGQRPRGKLFVASTECMLDGVTKGADDAKYKSCDSLKVHPQYG